MPRGDEYPGPPDALDHYRAIVDAADRDIEVKGAKNPYTSANGHMFSFLDPDGTMAVRLPDDLRDEFLERHDSGPVVRYGSVMQGYVSIPDEMFAGESAVVTWLEASFDWVTSLPSE